MSSDEEREYNLMVTIFSVSAGMIGVCLTGIGLMRVVTSLNSVGTLSDELLAFDAGVFLACCLLAFLSFRIRSESTRKFLRKLADTSFILGLLLMAVVCALITFVVI
jgi:hypothetical protein